MLDILLGMVLITTYSVVWCALYILSKIGLPLVSLWFGIIFSLWLWLVNKK